jgi:enoyl-CoA hydratase
MKPKNLVLNVENEVGWLTINRPDQRNSLDLTTLAEIEQTVSAWDRDPQVKVIVITGAGEKAFASGADLRELSRRTPLESLNPNMSGVYRTIEKCGKPTIAAINGHAAGGGLELALACDIRIAADHAKLGLPELGLAIIPGAGGTQRLSRLIGRGRALEMILTGDLITAARAESIGLISRAVPAARLAETALEYADKLKRKGPLAVRLAKAVIVHGAEIDMEAALWMEKLSQSILMGTEDKLEGTMAFLEKRTPVFREK